MGTFNITQTPISKDLYIYPESDDTVQLTPIGATNNFDCVNDTVGAGDDDTTYVYTNGVSAVSDLYTLSDHTTETGIINSITLYTKCKSHQYNQSSSGTYELLLGVKDASAAYYTYYKSSETSYGSRISPTTDYQIFSCLWTSNPSTKNQFTWTDIDNLKIGIKCSSPSQTNNLTKIWRPNGEIENESTAWAKVGDTTTYGCVDEETQDGYTSYIYVGGITDKRIKISIAYDTGTGTIDKLTYYYVIRADVAAPGNAGIWSSTGSEYLFSKNFATDWTLNTTEFIVNPWTSNAWTWAEIYNIYYGFDTAVKQCTQIYAVVDYHTFCNPEIRTTQCYAKINYNPGSSTCTLHKPQNYSINHRRDVKKINTWNNSRYVYDCGRLGKTLNMNGLEYTTTSSEASIALSCVKTMKDNSVKVTLSGFNDDNVNGDWFIRNFNFEKNTPIMYTWDMELEKA